MKFLFSALSLTLASLPSVQASMDEAPATFPPLYCIPDINPSRIGYAWRLVLAGGGFNPKIPELYPTRAIPLVSGGKSPVWARLSVSVHATGQRLLTKPKATLVARETDYLFEFKTGASLAIAPFPADHPHARLSHMYGSGTYMPGPAEKKLVGEQPFIVECYRSDYVQID